MRSKKKYICKNIGCKESFAYRSQRSRHAQKYSKEESQKLVSKSADGTFKCTKCTKAVKHRNNIRDTSYYVHVNQKGAKKSYV